MPFLCLTLRQSSQMTNVCHSESFELLNWAEIANAVANDDSSAFERVSGIGAKTAKLIVVSLAGKLKAIETNSVDSIDLLAAMQSLGWTERVAEPVVRQVLKSRADKPFADLIRECLAILGAKQ